MRGSEVRSGSLFSYVDLEARVPGCHRVHQEPRPAVGRRRRVNR
jgi:hypothetical protein